MTTKTARGQFNTTSAAWLYPQIRQFLTASLHLNNSALDPFAGEGDLLNAVRSFRPATITAGLDIDAGLVAKRGWVQNDSLLGIPNPTGAVIVTNPPYLAKQSAKRKGVQADVWHYYRDHTDLYQEALAQCLKAARFVCAIVPETVVNSGFDLRSCRSLSVVLEPIFDDTEHPVVVACFDREWVGGPEVFHGPQHSAPLSELLQHRAQPSGAAKLRFNVVGGQIGLRAVDLSDPSKPIEFMPAAQLGYGNAGIKVSSRVMTYIHVDGLPEDRVADVCRRANTILREARQLSHDAILSPFMGNNSAGSRRRRLDYDLARAVLERAFVEWVPKASKRPSRKATFNSRQGRLGFV